MIIVKTDCFSYRVYIKRKVLLMKEISFILHDCGKVVGGSVRCYVDRIVINGETDKAKTTNAETAEVR